MALITCKDCGTEHSSEAKACPKCGKPAPRKTSGCAIAGACVFAVFIVIMVKACNDVSTEQQIAQSSEATRRAALTPDQRAAEDAAKADEERAQSLATAGARQLKSSMRDPDSFQVARAFESHSDAICYVYRGKNGFGGMNVEQAIYRMATNEMYTGDRAQGWWDKLCAAQRTDLTIYAQVGAKY